MVAERAQRLTKTAGDGRRTPGWRSFHNMKRNRLVALGAVVVCLFVLMAIAPGLFARADPYEMNVGSAMTGPSRGYWFGTDGFGRDVWSRIAYGARTSLGIAFIAVSVALAVGTVLGVVGGYFGEAIDQLLGRLMDVLFGFPSLLLAIVVAGILGPSVQNAVLAIAIVYTPFFFRVVRGPVLVEREKEYVQAARVVGVRSARLLRCHILPNVIAPVVVQTSITLSYAILVEASLSYLGLGVQPPEPSWGSILNEGRPYLQIAPWISVFPGVAIMLAVMGFNLLGDGLRDVWDPRTGRT